MTYFLICLALFSVFSLQKSVYDMTEEEFKAMLKPATSHTFHFSRENPFTTLNLPHSFDSRKQFAGCIHPVRNQGQCGSCWSFATTGVISDRFCIKSSHSIDVVLSPQILVSCDIGVDLGCDGGEGKDSMIYATNHGLVTEECYPYTSGTTQQTGTCLVTGSQCVDTTVSYKEYKCKAPGPSSFNTNSAIMQEIQDNGPVFCEYAVYSDFKEYKSGIYYQTSKDLLGLHDVKLLGWGVENGINYWIAQNSWGADWGENGFFRIKMGSAGMCDLAWSCVPDV